MRFSIATVCLHAPIVSRQLKVLAIARTINAIDAEDALKYLPSLLVRKRL